MPQKFDLKFVNIIPARYKSSRFPGKPLVQIKGKSLIQRVWEKCCLAMSSSDVYIATDDKRIQQHCEELGMQVVMTSENCLTGTDRVFEASQQVGADIYINVQGDEPLIDPNDITQVMQESSRVPLSIVNAMCPIQKEADFRSLSIPKVVTRMDGRLLYMSRAAIPTTKESHYITANKQVCIYAFPKKCLADFVSVVKKTPMEVIEDIEILRFLELGYEVNMINVSSASIAVDFPEDVKKVENALSNE